MIELLSDGKTVMCIHHNRHHDVDYTGLGSENDLVMHDRTELWVSISRDDGHTWEEPRYLLSNALEPNLRIPFRNHQCSYVDIVIDGDMVNIFVPHRWQQVLHLKIKEADLLCLPTKGDMLP